MTASMRMEASVLKSRYRLCRVLGTGGTSRVYLADDLHLSRRVAVKQGLADDEETARFFRHEAEALKAIDYPGLPRVVDAFVDGQGHYLVMDYVEGEDLHAAIEARLASGLGPFPASVVRGWAERLLGTLEYLHARGIIHRDIKPANIKLAPDGSPVLIDFGLSKIVAAKGRAASATSVRGHTPGYAPFEQIAGNPTGPASDVYSLAATLYHLITGRAPEDALARASALLAGNGDPLPRADTVVAGIPPSLAFALDRAMAVKPEDRLQTAAEFRRELASPGASQPLRASDGGTRTAGSARPLPPPPDTIFVPPTPPKTVTAREPAPRRTAGVVLAEAAATVVRVVAIVAGVLALGAALAAGGFALYDQGRREGASATVPSSSYGGSAAAPAPNSNATAPASSATPATNTNWSADTKTGGGNSSSEPAYPTSPAATSTPEPQPPYGWAVVSSAEAGMRVWMPAKRSSHSGTMAPFDDLVQHGWVGETDDAVLVVSYFDVPLSEGDAFVDEVLREERRRFADKFAMELVSTTSTSLEGYPARKYVYQHASRPELVATEYVVFVSDRVYSIGGIYHTELGRTQTTTFLSSFALL